MLTNFYQSYVNRTNLVKAMFVISMPIIAGVSSFYSLLNYVDFNENLVNPFCAITIGDVNMRCVADGIAAKNIFFKAGRSALLTDKRVTSAAFETGYNSLCHQYHGDNATICLETLSGSASAVQQHFASLPEYTAMAQVSAAVIGLLVLALSVAAVVIYDMKQKLNNSGDRELSSSGYGTL